MCARIVASIFMIIAWHAVFIFPSNESFHGRIGLVGIDRNGRSRILGIIDLIRSSIAHLLHILRTLELASILRSTAHTSTCSFDHESMLNDLTFEIWVPNFRCMAAHRMHRKMPNYVPLAMQRTHHLPLDRRSLHSNLPILKHV